MKIEDIARAQQLTDMRTARTALACRIADEPLRLVLGKGSGEVEVVLAAQFLARIKRDATAALAQEIAEIDTRLRALGVTLPGDEPPPEAGPPVASRANLPPATAMEG